MENAWVIVIFLLGLGCVFLFYAWVIEPNRLIVRKVTLQGDVRKAVTLVQFSDVHFGRFKDARKAEALVKAIHAQHPDIILFTGDMIDNYRKTPNMTSELQPYLHSIQAAYGKYAVYGNHDIGGGARAIFADFMEACGFQVLCNDVKEIAQLQVAILGMDDPQAGYGDVQLSQRSVQPYQILMCHEPDYFEQVDVSTIDLMVSGHTHGGQISIPFLTKYFLPRGGETYVKGLYTRANTKLFVSSGIGMTFLPFRFGNPPEIVVFHIEPNK